MRFLKLKSTSLAASNRAVLAEGVGDGATGDDSNAEQTGASIEVIHPLGLVARPTITDNTELVAIQDGDEFIGLGIVDKSMATLGSSDLAEGAIMLFCPAFPAATNVKLDENGQITLAAGNAKATIAKDGDITINANNTTATLHNNSDVDIVSGTSSVHIHHSGDVDITSANNVNVNSGGGGSIVLNNGTEGVARNNDTTTDGSITWVFAGVTGAITYTPPGGGSPQTVTLTLSPGSGGASWSGAGSMTLSGQINSASSTVVSG